MYCTECREVVRWQVERKKQTRSALRRKPCEGCGGPKGPGQAKRLCARCKGDGQKMCIDCKVRPLRAKGMKYCELCKAEAIKRQRQRQHEWKLRNPEAVKAIRIRYEKSGRKRSKAYAETRRFTYRLKAADEGRVVRSSPVKLSEARTSGPWLEAEPTRRLTHQFILDGGTFVGLASLTGVSERRLREIHSDRQRFVSADTADRVCMARDTRLSLEYPEAA